MIELRPYQQECLAAIWNEILVSQTALVALSTGAGKSVIIYELLRKSIRAKPEIKCLVLFNRVTLLSQLAKRFKDALGENEVGIYCGSEESWDLSRRVTVGSIQSLDPGSLNFHLIIVDECHSINDEGGRYEAFIRRQCEANPKTKVVGFTATPFRQNGFIYGKDKLFTHICYQKGLQYFIQNGYLVPPISKQPDHCIDLSKLRILKGEYRQQDIDAQTMNIKMAEDQVADALNRAIGRNKIVWFAASINHAELLASLLRKQNETVSIIHSKMSREDRDKNQDDFLHRNRHLVNVSVVVEGFDQPSIDTIVLMRPTRSPVVMVQSCGRGLRPYPGKEDCLILDYGNVISSLGPLEDPVIGKKSVGGEKIAPSMKTCPECRTLVPPRVMGCPTCGFNWPKLEATKINLSADENAGFLKKTILCLEVDRVKIDHHTSKNGNDCIRISYLPKQFFAEPVTEYFAHKTEWGWRRLLLRAIDLGLDVQKDMALQQPQRVPAKIEYVMEAKYPKVKRLIFNEKLS